MVVESPGGVGVTDVLDDVADDVGDFDIGLRGDFTGDERDAGGQNRFACHPREFVLGNDGVQDAVGDLIGNLVRMALGDGLGREEVVVSHETPQGSMNNSRSISEGMDGPV